MSSHRCQPCPRSKHLATKKRSKENAFNHATLSVHSVQFPFIGAPKARCSPEPPMVETLLLANPDIDTLRHQCSRASSVRLRTRTVLSFFRRATRPQTKKTANANFALAVFLLERPLW